MIVTCVECGYDLSKTDADGNGDRVCPECGKRNAQQALADAAAAAAEAETETRVRRVDWPWLPLDILLLLVSVGYLGWIGVFAATPWWFMRAIWLARARKRIAGEDPSLEKYIRTTAWVCIRAWMLVVLVTLLAQAIFRLVA